MKEGLNAEDSTADQNGKIKETGKLHSSKGKSVMGLAYAPLKTVRIGLIGIGMLGSA